MEQKILRQLIEEQYGALAWLQALELSYRARVCEAKRLQEALADTAIPNADGKQDLHGVDCFCSVCTSPSKTA